MHGIVGFKWYDNITNTELMEVNIPAKRVGKGAAGAGDGKY